MHDTTTQCFHCGQVTDQTTSALLNTKTPLIIHFEGTEHAVCCIGCKSVAEFIIGSQQSDYYRFRQGHPDKIDETTQKLARRWSYYDTKPEYWGDPHSQASSSYTSFFDVVGIHCAACGWLIQTQLAQLSGVLDVQIDIATGITKVEWDSDKIHFSQLPQTITQLGYEPNLLGKIEQNSSFNDQALKRLVVAGLGMMQVMMYSVALYAGEWHGMEAKYERFLSWVSLLITTPVLFYSGLPFIRNAIVSIRHRSVHMDIPIACAMLLAYGLSTVNFFRDEGSIYFDSVVMFIFFISAARFLQQRVQQRNVQTRQALTRMLPNFVETAGKKMLPLEAIAIGDELLIPTGGVVPVDATLVSTRGEFDESLLTGESQPIIKQQHCALSAGVINVGQGIKVAAVTDSRRSSLSILGQRLAAGHLIKNDLQIRLAKFASGFVLGVIFLALATVSYWWQQGQLNNGLEAALAVLVISCPCAISLAIPASLAALTQGLHRQGIHVVSADALLSLAKVTTAFFDKTGTLTTLQFSMDKIHVLGHHDLDKRSCLALIASLAKTSIHPKATIFASINTDLCAQNTVEIKGGGVIGTIDGTQYAYASAHYLETQGLIITDENNKTNSSEYLARLNDRGQYELLAIVQLKQTIRQDAHAVLKTIENMGVNVEILSGDQHSAVHEVAQQLGVREYRGQMNAEQKRDRIEACKKIQHQKGPCIVAAIGDGINDAEVLNRADIALSFTDATQLAQANADILIGGNSLRPVADVFSASKRLLKVVKINITWAVLYNVLLVPLAVLGHISPWMAALGMSLSSLFVVLNASRLNRQLPSVISSKAHKSIIADQTLDTIAGRKS